jgi:hypothetical protein
MSKLFDALSRSLLEKYPAAADNPWPQTGPGKAEPRWAFC